MNLIEQLVLAMGSRWVPGGPNEIGTDGFIELFDPTSHQALGRTVAVQSKAVTDFLNNTNETFDFWCSRQDLDYWLRSNVPVMLVVSRPASNEAYWVFVKDAFPHGASGQSTRVRFSKLNDRLDSNALERLVGGAGPAGSAQYLGPVERKETLFSNLLSLEKAPESVFVASTDLRSTREVWAKLSSYEGSIDSAWVLENERIFAFHDLSKVPWSSVCDVGTVEPIPTREWSDSDDPDRRRFFVRLLNWTLRSQLAAADVRFWPNEESYAFEAGESRSIRRVRYMSAKKPSTVTVVSKYSSKSGERTFEWFRHLAFRGQFRRLDGSWYLELTPTYRFTRDGHNIDRFHAERLKGIKRLEGNRAVLSAVLLWADVLSRQAAFFDQSNLPLQFGPLLRFTLDHGVDDRLWLSADVVKPKAKPSSLLTLDLPESEPAKP